MHTAGNSCRGYRVATGVLAGLGAALAALLSLVYYADAARAHHDVLTVYMDDAALRHQLNNLFPKGSPRRDIEYFLSNTPVSHGGFDPQARRIEGSIRAPQRLPFIAARQPVHLVLQFDQAENLDSVSFDRG